MSSSSRLLLDVVSECAVVENAKNRAMEIGSFLSAYYGSDDAFLGSSLCRYESFLDGGDASTSCPPASFPVGISENFTIGGAGASDVSLASFNPMRLRRAIDDWFEKPKADVFRDMIELTSDWSTAAVGCDADTLLCRKQRRSILEGIVLSETWIVLGLSALLLSGINVLSISFFVTGQFIALPSLVLYLTYEFPTSCLPRMPTCLGDDVFDLMVALFPRHISWSPLVVQNASRAPFGEYGWFEQLEGTVSNCEEVGFGGFFDPLFWAREKTRDQGYELAWNIVEWPLLIVIPGARSTARDWKKRELTPLVDECARLAAVGIVPPVVLSFFAYLTISFAIVPTARFVGKLVVRVFPFAMGTIKTLLDAYNSY